MRDFDTTPDLEFKLGGETFVAQRVRPEVLAEFASDNVDLEEAQDSTKALALLDERIEAFLEHEEDRARYRELRQRTRNPVTIGQLNALLEWMLEVSSDLPTEQPSTSVAGPGTAAGLSRGR